MRAKRKKVSLFWTAALLADWKLFSELGRKIIRVFPKNRKIEVVSFPSMSGSCVLCAPLDRHIGRHIDRQSTDVSVDISAECRPICRSTYRSSVGQYVDRDVSLDISADISVEHWSICRLTLDRYVGRYVDREWSSDCRPTCRSIGYRHATDTSLLLAYWWLLVTSAAQISLIYFPLLRGYFVYNPASLSSVLHQHLVILRRPYPLSCQLYFVYLAVFHLSVLLDNDWICGTWRPNMNPSEIFEVDQKDEMSITYTV